MRRPDHVVMGHQTGEPVGPQRNSHKNLMIVGTQPGTKPDTFEMRVRRPTAVLTNRNRILRNGQ